MEEIWQDRQERGFLLFLAVFCALLLGSGILAGFWQAQEVRNALLGREARLVSGMLDFKQDGSIGRRGDPSSADGADTGKSGMAVSGSQAGGGTDRSFFVYGSRCAWRSPFFGGCFISEKTGSAV